MNPMVMSVTEAGAGSVCVDVALTKMLLPFAAFVHVVFVDASCALETNAPAPISPTTCRAPAGATEIVRIWFGSSVIDESPS